MSDKDEAIARWMGDVKLYACRHCGAANDQYLGPKWVWIGPRYTESLDALVPVMEALTKEHCRTELAQMPEGKRWLATVVLSNAAEKQGSSDKPAEALRNAIYAAIVAMQEIGDE